MAKSCLEIIEEYYGDKSAKRSGVPYMNHIYEGLAILENLDVTEYIKDAYCLHPIFQDDSTLLENLTGNKDIMGVSPTVLIIVMEYRNVANRGLSCFQVDDPDKIYLSPLPSVKSMLIADKVQNRKDFLKYHFSTHPKSKELDIYFKNWLRVLGVTEAEYDRLAAIADRCDKFKANTDCATCTFEEFVIACSKPSILRYGQKIMNHLAKVWPNKYTRISGTHLDCYHKDESAKFTLEHLKQVWKSKQC